MPVGVPEAVAVPVRVEPHCEIDGAEIVTAVDAGLSVVVTFDESVDEPDAETETEDDVRPVTGPVPAGQTASAVGVRHSCGASPTT
jgi:hypothetical protein